MTLQSLQKIISLENELHAAEQVEQENASAWLQEQEEAILRQHESSLSSLEEKIAEVKEQAASEAKAKAAAMFQRAEKQAELLASLEDDDLRRHLDKTLKFIIGHSP